MREKDFRKIPRLREKDQELESIFVYLLFELCCFFTVAMIINFHEIEK